MDRRSFIGFGTLAASVLIGGNWTRAFADEAKGAPGPVVSTTEGKIRGLQLGGVQAFKGVPYADTTAGANRFMPPAKCKGWTKVRECFELGHRSPQLLASFHGQVPPEVEAMDRDEPMGEDCLVLNVWTPGVGAGHKRPVMVWLHGGGFTSGSGGFIMYDGANLARKQDLVVITLNHRLTVFGYLYLAGIGAAQYANSSNLGNLDIIAALGWVRDNIAAFGGDPGNVTIFGQSGGGGKVSSLMAMPGAKGLFHRAIAESGAEVKGIPAGTATKTAEEYLSKLNLKPTQADELERLSTEQLLSVMPAGLGGGLNMGPVVDGRTLPRDPFDPTAPEISADIPLLIGTVETEVTFFPHQILDPIDDASLHQHVKQTLRGASDAKVDELIALYRKGRPKASNTDLYLIIASDATFRRGVLIEADRKADQGKAAVYQYYFTWRSPVRDGKLRTFHTLEIPFVFDNVDLAKSMTGDRADRYPLEAKMSGAWAAFARNGNPNHQGLANWPTFNTSQRAVMIFNDECKAVDDPYGAERRLLAEIQATG
jgi:para-nitrobenzyl esterase